MSSRLRLSHVCGPSTVPVCEFHTVANLAICQNHCAILYVYIGDVADAGGVLTFYIPTIIDDVD